MAAAIQAKAYYALDCETTHRYVSHEVIEIVELSIVKIEPVEPNDPKEEIVNGKRLGAKITVVYEKLFMPRNRIRVDASAIHKLTKAVLQRLGAKEFTTQDALDIFDKVQGSRGLVAWNSDFDRKALLTQCSR